MVVPDYHPRPRLHALRCWCIWDHVKEIPLSDIKRRPIVTDENGWVLDGNHRATAARARGLETIPALVPYTK